MRILYAINRNTSLLDIARGCFVFLYVKHSSARNRLTGYRNEFVSMLSLTREPLGVPPADRDAAYARGRYQKVTSRKFFISANGHPFSRYRASKLEKCKLWAVITRDLLKQSRWPNWHFCRPCWDLQSLQYLSLIWFKRYWAISHWKTSKIKVWGSITVGPNQGWILARL